MTLDFDALIFEQTIRKRQHSQKSENKKRAFKPYSCSTYIGQRYDCSGHKHQLNTFTFSLRLKFYFANLQFSVWALLDEIDPYAT